MFATRWKRHIAALVAGIGCLGAYLWFDGLVWLGLAGVVLAAWLAGHFGWRDRVPGTAGLAMADVPNVLSSPELPRMRAPLVGADFDAGAANTLFPAASFLEAMPDPAILIDHHGGIVATNARLAELGKIGQGVSVGAIMRAPEIQAAVARVVAEGSSAEVVLRFGVESDRRLTAWLFPVARGAGVTSRILISLRDRTEAERLDRARAAFVANASHELRTPLAALRGFVETLRGAAKDDPAARERFLEIMWREVNRMGRLIDDLLSLSRAEMMESVPLRELVDLAGVVHEVEAALGHQAKRAGCSLLVAMAEDAPQVHGARDELVRMLGNLIDNAIKYCGTGGTIRVHLAREADMVALRVEDNGVGIAPEHLPRLTERFFRTNDAVARAHGGAGLGLAIVKHIVNRHQGRLAIESAPGGGTTVRVWLPVPVAR